MKTSTNGKIALAVSEGIVDTAYLDNAKPPVWTLGIGHTLGAGNPNPRDWIGKKMSIEQIFDMFAVDLVKYESIVDRNVKVPLLQHEYDALVHFVYNVGEGNFKKSKLLANLNAGKKQEAWQSGFHGWLIPKSLETRRDKERLMAQKGIYGSKVAPLYTASTAGKTKRNGSINLANYNFDKPSTGKETPSESSTNIVQAIVDFILKLFSKK